jgi:Fe-S cluster assembly ATPase SufC
MTKPRVTGVAMTRHLRKAFNVKEQKANKKNNKYNRIIGSGKKQRQIKRKFFLKKILSWVLVAHACNVNFSGGRDQEERGLKPALANSLQDPILKTPSTKKD